jgi:hypothetical protein
VLTAAWQGRLHLHRRHAGVLPRARVRPAALNWGDSASDYNVTTSGRNFAKYGFLYLPYAVRPRPAYMTNADSAMVYTPTRSCPRLMNGPERVVPVQDLMQFLALVSHSPPCSSSTSSSAFTGRAGRQLALALWVINPPGLARRLSHHAPYAAFFGFGRCISSSGVNSEERRGFWSHRALSSFSCSWRHYDFWIFVPLLLAMMTDTTGGPVVRVLGRWPLRGGRPAREVGDERVGAG